MKFLSKSQFTRGLQCEKSLWLYREKKDLQDPVSPDAQMIFDQGTEVGVLARSWIGGGVLIKADHTNPQLALDETMAALQAGATVLYEAAFLHDDVLVRVDILAKGPGGVWDLYEVKSTTKVEEAHLPDVAIQRYVVAGAGLQLGVAHVVHLDPSYVRHGALDLRQLFASVDVNKDTEPLIDVIQEQVRNMKKTAALPAPPVVGIGQHCSKPHGCSFRGHCWAHVPKYSVFNLTGARKDKTARLWNSGIKTIAEIPEFDKADSKTKDYKLTDFQIIQRNVAISGKPYKDVRAIREHLDALTYPLHFLDFEAINPAIPQYDGTRPYQPLPFEASIHVQAERGAPLEHFEFLSDGTTDPRRGLAAFLGEHLGPKGSIIAYNKSYEGNIMLALSSGGFAGSWIENAEGRLWDLMDFFRKAMIAYPEFKGSYSIKKILPVLVPGMKYDGMAINDGVAAMRAFYSLMTENLSATERAQIMTDLKLYCGQDTIGMSKILDVVMEDVGVAA